MATNFRTNIAINWLHVDDSEQAIGYDYEGGLSGQPTECRYCRSLHLRDVAMATTFWLSMGYNFGCMIASNKMSDSRGGPGGFSESSNLMKT